MATKKIEEAAAEVQAEEKKIEEFGWEDMRDIFLPKDSSDGRKSQYVCINGREFVVPRGKRVSVPYPVYERLEFMLEAQAKAEEEAEQVPDRV